jgi:hypothetical protein
VTAGRVSLRAVLQRPVMVGDVRLGAPTDAVLDSESRRVVGLEVTCPDGVRRFLPLAAARIRKDRVAVGSALMLLEEGEREFYRRLSRTFVALLGSAVARDGQALGNLVDLVIARDGAVEAVATQVSGSGARLHERAGVTLAPARRASAA